MLDGAVRNRENRRVLNHNHCGRFRRRSRMGKRQAEKTSEANEPDGEFSRTLHWAPPSTAVELAALLVGFTPVKSSEYPCTLILPFSEVPSNVPEKVTSAGEPSIGMLIVKLNLSTLR